MPRINNLIPRAAWGAREDNGFADRPMPVREWWLHHSVTVAPNLLPPFTDDDAAVRLLEKIGEREFGGGISYTVVITPTGRAYEGHSINRRGAHTYGHNTVAAAICFVGNYENQKPTSAQILAAAQTLVRARRQNLSTRHTLNGGHRDVYPTACPGRHAYAVIGQINAQAQKLWADGYGKTLQSVPAPTSQANSSIPNLPPTGVDRDRTRRLQGLLELTADGLWGDGTDEWAMRMRTAARTHVGSPKVSKAFREDAVQRVIDVTPDGIFGPKSVAALRAWVVQLQRLLGVAADGWWGEGTDAAFMRLRKSNKNKF